MGIPKLDSFIKQNSGCMDSVILRDSKLVIEGYALCLHLYFAYFSDTWFYGGDYYEYYNKLCNYFDELKKRNIDAYVVMSGIDIDPKKEAKHLRQLRESNKIIANLQSRKNLGPLFVAHVFLDVLRKKNINFFFADDEIDREIASLANHFCCPVLSADSDFYIFKLEGGFIPLTNKNCKNLVKEMPVDIFRYQCFSKHFSLRDNDLLLFLPIFLGNYYSRSPVSPKRLNFSEKPKVNEVLTYLQGFRSFAAVENDLESGRKQHLIKRRESAKEFYTVQAASFEELAKRKEKLSHLMSRKEKSSHLMPSWVFAAYKQGKFQKELMSFLVYNKWNHRGVVEDIEQESAWEFTRDIREVIMATLTPTISCSSTCREILSTYSCNLTTDSNVDTRSIATQEVTTENNSEYDYSTEDNTSEEDSVTDDSEIFLSDSLTSNDSSESEPEYSSDTEDEKNDQPLNTETNSTQVVEWQRDSGQPTVNKKTIQIKCSLIHNMIDYTLTWRRPDSRRRALLVIADCCEIKTKLETVPEDLQLAVIATHYWVKKNRAYLGYLQALISCILTCYSHRRKVKPRRLPSSASLRPLAHVFAHWQCTLHDVILLNQVLNQPYQYTSPAHLFSGSILHYFLENRHEVIHDQLAYQLRGAII